jgi:hypothetical protein
MGRLLGVSVLQVVQRRVSAYLKRVARSALSVTSVVNQICASATRLFG